MNHALSAYTAFDTVNRREALALDMELAVDRKLAPFHADVNSLQLLGFTLPSEFDSAISETTVAEQLASTVGFQQVAAAIEADATVEQARLNAELILFEADAEAEGILATANATAGAILKQLQEEASTYRLVQQEMQAFFGTTNWTTSHLMSFIWLDSVQSNDNAKLNFNIDVPDSLHLP